MVSNKYAEPFTFNKLDHHLSGGYRPRERRDMVSSKAEQRLGRTPAGGALGLVNGLRRTRNLLISSN